MPKVRYQALGPLLAGEGSRAFLGLEIPEVGAPCPVVLVWVPEAIMNDEAALKKLRRETAQAAHLEHPNIIRVHGLAQLDEGLARVVEFVDGESVRNLLNVAKRIPPRLASLIVADAALGIHHAHQAGKEDQTPLVHGDLRPETLLVTFTGVCKVTGYGAVSLAPREIGGKRIPGRRYHAAPEQVVGGREAIDRQTDVYLLGLLLYECLTGAVPFADHEEFERAVLLRPLPAAAPEQVSPELFHVVRQATAKRAVERYRSALALREALEQAVRGLPSREELAAFLREHFPEDHPARIARRGGIETGAREAARASRPAIPEPQVAPPALEPTPILADESDKASSRRKFVSMGVLAAAAVGIAIAAYWMLAEQSPPGTPSPGIARAIEAESKARAARTMPSAPVPSTSNDAEVNAAEAPGQQPDAPQSARPVAVATKPPPPVRPQEPERASPAAASPNSTVKPSSQQIPSSLQVTAEPPLEISVDGHSFGRSPVDVPLPPGTHTVVLSDRDKGINVTRTVKIGPGGKTPLHLVLGKGFVEVSAPDGAMVFIDGKLLGKAPLKEFALFEGRHQIQVNYDKAKWKKGFAVHRDEHLSFTVETTSE